MKASACAATSPPRDRVLPLHEYPARYCTGYLGDIGVRKPGAMDFSAWFEVFLGGNCNTFDAAPQHSSDRPRPRRPGTRTSRRCNQHDVRCEQLSIFGGDEEVAPG